jgi:hypothetical protein
MVQTTQLAAMPGLATIVVQVILSTATPDSVAIRNNKLEIEPIILDALRTEPDSAATVVQTTVPAATPESTANILPASTPESATTKNNKLEIEPTILDAPRTELSGKSIFPINKNLVAPPFPGRLKKARKEESEHDIF